MTKAYILFDQPLLEAVDQGNETEVERLLNIEKQDCNVQAPKTQSLRAVAGFSSLHILCSGNRNELKHVRVLKIILARKNIDLNPVNDLGDTPLITAAYYGRLLACELILQTAKIS